MYCMLERDYFELYITIKIKSDYQNIDSLFQHYVFI